VDVSNERTEWELLALAALADGDGPIGASGMTRRFRVAGYSVSEATMGRFLRQLDELGLTQSFNTTKGRLITDEGRRRLGELRVERRRHRHGARLLSAVYTDDMAELVDLLQVRRLVEVESARLAAERATNEEINQMLQLGESHIDQAGRGDEISSPSMAFHRLLAEASHSRMLTAVTLLLLDPANDPLERMLEELAIQAGVTVDHVTDHRTIALAIERRDPTAAMRAMSLHMDKLMAVTAAVRIGNGQATSRTT
jgi:DNA-binding FadR family transcriptional regulator